MMMPGLGWSTDNAWTFPLPTADYFSYCEVITTQITTVTEDGIISVTDAVYFHDLNGCNQPCT